MKVVARANGDDADELRTIVPSPDQQPRIPPLLRVPKVKMLSHLRKNDALADLSGGALKGAR